MKQEQVFGGISYEYAIGCIQASSRPPLSQEQWNRFQSGSFSQGLGLLRELGCPVRDNFLDALEEDWQNRLGIADRSFAFLPTEEPAQELPAGISQQELLEQVHQAVNAALEEAGWGDPMGVIAGYFFQKKLEYRTLGRLLCETKTAGGKAG